MIDFPTSPVVGQAYTFGNRTWVWNSSGWERQINAGQVVSIFVLTPYVFTCAALAQIDPDWATVNYV